MPNTGITGSYLQDIHLADVRFVGLEAEPLELAAKRLMLEGSANQRVRFDGHSIVPDGLNQQVK